MNNVALAEWEKVCIATGELSSGYKSWLMVGPGPSVPASLGPGSARPDRYNTRVPGEAWHRDFCEERLREREAHPEHYYITILARVQTTYFTYLGKQ